VSRKAHNDGEQRPPAGALQALGAWLDANGLRRVALVEVLGSSQVHVSRLFAGGGFLSATQRRALEKFTGGAVTVAALEGKVEAPTRVGKKRSAPSEPRAVPQPQAPPATEVIAPVAAPPPKPQTTEEAERLVDELATKAMPAAFKLVVQQMVQAKSESERRRCAEILIEHLRGKAKQYERRERMDAPATDTELIEVFQRIALNLGVTNARPVPHVAGGAVGDGYGGEGLA
jgi:hypothetical protein